MTVDPLTAAQVRAVRFAPARPGYAYEQVEAFVEQVAASLDQWSTWLAEAEDEIELLREQNATLAATIEVFRASGDPLGDGRGGFLTR